MAPETEITKLHAFTRTQCAYIMLGQFLISVGPYVFRLISRDRFDEYST